MLVMNKFFILLGMLCLAFPISSCRENTEENSSVVHFKGRDIDIKSFYTEFPYTTYMIKMSKDGSKLFYTRNGKTTDLMMLDLSQSSNLDDGKVICKEDFSVKNLWKYGYNEADGCLYWIGDEKNDEIINLYRLNIETGEIKKLTDVPYIYGWSLNDTGTHISYIARLGQNEKRLDELHIINLKTLEDKKVFTDNPNYRLTWSEISVQPDGNGATLSILKDADRRYTNIGYIDFKSGKLNILTDSSKEGSLDGTDIISPWLSNDEVYYLSNQSGYANVYSYNKKTKKISQITNYSYDVEAKWIKYNEKNYLALVSNSPAESKLSIFDPVDKKVVAEKKYQASIGIATTNNNIVYLSAQAVDIIYEIWAVTFENGEMTQKTIMNLPKEKSDKLVTSTVERLSIPTFDRDLHAYLLTPKNPLKEKMVMIQSFYGGSNSYDMEHQIFTDAGIYVLSPSPRGTSGFGRDFAALNDKDLGGDEIIDIIYCAKYISEKLGVPSERIGVFGMSHGGYATMRLLTFPGVVNGKEISFPFGFGVAVAGFADIIYQHNHSNIPDWTFLEAGDPIKDKEKLMDRSPISHIDKITGPLLLIHGNHDDRVDIEGSRMIYNALTKIGKPVTFLEVEGQGHGFKGLDNNILYYKTIFNFLEELK